jgi:predicted glycoside hydrolase/deacetylase ChbG (UPF0249 family)
MSAKLFSLVWVLLLVNAAVLAQKQPPRLIVRGDDMGFSHGGNVALIKSYRDGIETSIEVIVPSPWFPEAVKLLQDNPNVDVGVHLALTSEWDNIKYRPITNCPSLTDEDGYFYPMIWPNKNYPGQALREHNFDLVEIEKELRAQIELALKRIPGITHLSGHMGCSNMSPEVAAITRKLAREYEIDIDLQGLGVKGVSYDGPKESAAEKISSFIKMLEGLQPGETYLFVDHPGIDSPELRAIYHMGYEEVAVDRQGVTDAWTDPRVKEAVKRLGIKLISYADLK